MLSIDDFASVENITRGADQLQMRLDELAHVLDMDMPRGYYMQFGVHKAFTLNHMARIRPDVHWYGFDSFEGLPHDWNLGGKAIPASKFRLAEPPKVKENVSLIKGWFKDSLPIFEALMSEPCAFIDIDSDVYESARDVLWILNDLIVPGTLIRFDELCDWRMKGWVERETPVSLYTTWEEHEWRALNEWCKDFGREVEAVHRNDHMAGTIRVKQ